MAKRRCFSALSPVAVDASPGADAPVNGGPLVPVSRNLPRSALQVNGTVVPRCSAFLVGPVSKSVGRLRVGPVRHPAEGVEDIANSRSREDFDI